MPGRSGRARVDLLVLSPHLAPPPGGIQRFAENVADAFPGKVVRVVGVSDEARADERYRIVRQRSGRFAELVTTLHYAAVAAAEVARGPRVIQAMTWRAALPAFAVPRRAPLVLFCMGGELVRTSGGAPAAWVRLRILRRATAIVAISRFTAGLVEDLSQRTARIVRPPLRDLPEPEPPVAHDGVAVVSVGRLVKNKGHDRLIRAVVAARKGGVDLRLTIVGGGPEHDALQRLVTEHGAHEFVDLVGAVSDDALDELYRSSDIFALLSVPVAGEVEGFGIVFLEANRYGLPVVAGRSGGSEDAVADGESGLLVADEIEAANALVALATDPARRRELGGKGRARLSEFTMAGFGEQLAKVYADIGVGL